MGSRPGMRSWKAPSNSGVVRLNFIYPQVHAISFLNYFLPSRKKSLRTNPPVIDGPISSAISDGIITIIYLPQFDLSITSRGLRVFIPANGVDKFPRTNEISTS